MRALLFKAVGELLAVGLVADPDPGEGEMVVRVSCCGVCGTDLHATSGHGMQLPADTVLGHEYSGEIVALGKGVDNFKVGDHVAALPVVGCGRCEACKTGIDVLCSNWSSYGAGLAEFARVSARGATKLPQTLSLADGALVEPMAVGARGVRLAEPRPDSRVLIIGPGPIGLAVLFWLGQRGVRNIVMLLSSDRRRALAESMGNEHFLTEGDSVALELRAALGGPPDFVFEAAGVPGTLNRAIELVRPGGTVVALGFCLQPEPIVPGMVLMKDVTLRFSITYARDDYTACVNALDKDGDRARAMVTDVVGFEAAPSAFESLRAGKGGGGKLLIDPWS